MRRDRGELGAIVRESAASAPERERRPDDQGVPELVADRDRLIEGVRDPRLGHVQTGAEHRLFEPAPVFGGADRVERRAEHADAEPVELSRFGERHADVQRGLAAERRQQRVRLLALEDLQHRRRGQRLDVGPIGERRVGHDRRWVGVHEGDLEPLGAKHLARLRARVVELARLADHDRARADHQDPLDVLAPRHQPSPICARNSSNR